MRHIRTLWIASLLVITSALTACKTESNYFVDENASGGDGTDNGAPTTATGFRVRVKAKTGVDSFLHRFGSVGTPCEIPKADADVPTDINCMLNMMEYDIWFHGFEYELNVPEGFCHFIEERPYGYYLAPAGAPPQSVQMEVVNGNVTDCVVDGVAAIGFGGLSCNTGEGMLFADGTFHCEYNYNRTNPNRPNCCQGPLTAEITVFTPNDQGQLVGVIRVVNIEGGGKYQNCIDSPHKYAPNWPQTTESMPATTVLELGNASYTRTQRLPSDMELRATRPQTRSVTLLAGFHDWAAYAANPATWSTTRTVPRAFAPLMDKGRSGNFTAGTPIASVGDGSYQFSCLGPAGELRHRIRLYLNEWNTIEDFQEFKTNGDPSVADPNRVGLSGTDCAAVNSGDTCNTFWGFDDLINSFGAGNPAAYVFPGEYWSYTPN